MKLLEPRRKAELPTGQAPFKYNEILQKHLCTD